MFWVASCLQLVPASLPSSLHVHARNLHTQKKPAQASEGSSAALAMLRAAPRSGSSLSMVAGGGGYSTDDNDASPLAPAAAAVPDALLPPELEAAGPVDAGEGDGEASGSAAASAAGDEAAACADAGAEAEPAAMEEAGGSEAEHDSGAPAERTPEQPVAELEAADAEPEAAPAVLADSKDVPAARPGSSAGQDKAQQQQQQQQRPGSAPAVAGGEELQQLPNDAPSPARACQCAVLRVVGNGTTLFLTGRFFCSSSSDFSFSVSQANA